MPSYLTVLRQKLDPRYYQALVQTSLLIYGWLSLDFPFKPEQVIAVLFTAFLTQFLCLKYLNLPWQGLSTLNTSLSIILLLYANSLWWLSLASLLAISSKFLIRYQNHHVFNPSNVGIVAVLLLTDSVWVAVGKWGHGLWEMLLLAGIGLVILLGWQRMLTSLVFLSSYTCLLFARAFWLGDPLSIPLHQLENGALLIFCFFMLSDPMTVPRHLIGRCVFGFWVALLAWYLQNKWFLPNAFLYALALSSPLVIFINLVWNHEPYRWHYGRNN